MKAAFLQENLNIFLFFNPRKESDLEKLYSYGVNYFNLFRHLIFEFCSKT